MSDRPFETPAASFSFRISIAGKAGQIYATDVSGISQDIETQSVEEGGGNRLSHALPQNRRTVPLILKRIMAPKDAPVVGWVNDTLSGDLTKPIQTKNIDITLIDHNKQPVMHWQARTAYPVKWSLGAFDAQTNRMSIEEIELFYKELVRL